MNLLTQVKDFCITPLNIIEISQPPSLSLYIFLKPVSQQRRHRLVPIGISYQTSQQRGFKEKNSSNSIESGKSTTRLDTSQFDQTRNNLREEGLQLPEREKEVQFGYKGCGRYQEGVSLRGHQRKIRGVGTTRHHQKSHTQATEFHKNTTRRAKIK